MGVSCFLTQLLEVGFFHSDPHPGNLLVDQSGRLVLIDFGLCAEIDRPDTVALTSGIVHLMRGDVPAMIDDAIALQILPPTVDRAALIPVLQSIFDRGRQATQGVQGQATHTHAAVAMRKMQFGAISRELNQVFFEHPFRVP